MEGLELEQQVLKILAESPQAARIRELQAQIVTLKARLAAAGIA